MQETRHHTIEQVKERTHSNPDGTHLVLLIIEDRDDSCRPREDIAQRQEIGDKLSYLHHSEDLIIIQQESCLLRQIAQCGLTAHHFVAYIYRNLRTQRQVKVDA